MEVQGCRDSIRHVWMMTMLLACVDVLHEQRLCGELTANPWTCGCDSIHVGELRFMVGEEASVQDGAAVERRGSPSVPLLKAWAHKHAAKGPFKVRLL